MKISYLVSTYDSGSYLDRHIADLLEKQTDPDYEVIVMNPASPGTDALIGQKWADADCRIKYFEWPEREWYGVSWLRAWQQASGQFVVNSNTDDYHAPQFTAEFHKNMTFATSGMHAGRKIGFGYAGIQVINEQGQLLGQGIKPPFDFEKYSYECQGGPQLCWRNDDAFKQSLDWDLMFKRAAQYRSAFDYWLILYFMSLGYHGHVIPQMLTIYTQRPGSIENSNKSANNYETYAAISEFFGHNFKGYLKHAVEFENFASLPPREEWIATMQTGKKWRS